MSDLYFSHNLRDRLASALEDAWDAGNIKPARRTDHVDYEAIANRSGFVGVKIDALVTDVLRIINNESSEQ